MRNYEFRFFGGVGTKPLDFEECFMNDDWAVRRIQLAMPHYYPIYYSAALWENTAFGDKRLVAEFTSSVVVTTNKKEN